MANRNNHLNMGQAYAPKRCWVGDTHKICYATKEEAELAARAAEHDHHINNLTVYKCDYGDHWHLSSKLS